MLTEPNGGAAFYVATAWNNRESARIAMQQIQAAGHYVTHDWTGMDGEQGPLESDETYFDRCALCDRIGVETADALILLAHPEAYGAMVEFGMALAAGVPVYVVTHPQMRDCIFYHLVEVEKVSSVAEAIERAAARQAE